MTSSTNLLVQAPFVNLPTPNWTTTAQWPLFQSGLVTLTLATTYQREARNRRNIRHQGQTNSYPKKKDKPIHPLNFIASTFGVQPHTHLSKRGRHLPTRHHNAVWTPLDHARDRYNAPVPLVPSSLCVGMFIIDKWKIEERWSRVPRQGVMVPCNHSHLINTRGNLQSINHRYQYLSTN